MSNAAEMLTGLTLAGGWRVVERLERTPSQTGGNFCVGYKAVREGEVGFVKALNLGRAISSPDPVRMLQFLTTGFNFERDLLRKCGANRMSHVVVSLSDGVIDVPNVSLGRVNYIIFEWAKEDIRTALAATSAVDLAMALRSLHHIAVGLTQLHSRLIAHQDLKPSNVLQFEVPDSSTAHSKVSDLGRSTDHAVAAEHDELPVAGDPSYAPPEQLYRSIAADFGTRRLACDLYQLGSMIAFIFSGFTVNGLLYAQTPPAQHWSAWSGNYEEVEPYLRDAFGHVCRYLSDHVPGGADGDLMKMIEYLCDPDPVKRGDPITRGRPGNQFDLHRVVTRLDLLARRAELGLFRTAAA